MSDDSFSVSIVSNEFLTGVLSPAEAPTDDVTVAFVANGRRIIKE